MSERASFYLGSVGLLGEYCPTSRKKIRNCMHLGPIRDLPHHQGSDWMQPYLFGKNQPSGIEEATGLLKNQISAVRFIFNSSFCSL